MTGNLVTSERLESECQAHWEQLGLNSPEKLKAHIQSLFDQGEDQTEIIVSLYQLVFPDWESIRKIHGHPVAGEELWAFIARRFQDFDRRRHPRVLPGGAWMNLGFASSPELEPWEISFAPCNAELSPAP